MESITLEEAVRILRQNLEEGDSLLKHYNIVVEILSCLFKDENVKKAFQLNLSEEEVIEYAQKVVLSHLGDQMTQNDIYKIEIVSDSPKKLLIDANAHFDFDDSYSCEDAKSAIKKRLEIFTGYNADISL